MQPDYIHLQKWTSIRSHLLLSKIRQQRVVYFTSKNCIQVGVDFGEGVVTSARFMKRGVQRYAVYCWLGLALFVSAVHIVLPCAAWCCERERWCKIAAWFWWGPLWRDQARLLGLREKKVNLATAAEVFKGVILLVMLYIYVSMMCCGEQKWTRRMSWRIAYDFWFVRYVRIVFGASGNFGADWV
jgi:hypothetical protein